MNIVARSLQPKMMLSVAVCLNMTLFQEWCLELTVWFRICLYTCFSWRLVYRTRVFVFFLADGVGWVGVGWGGLITFNGTSTHT